MSSICANWLTVYIITVNTQHVQVNTLSFNSVLFYFLQDFQLIAWCSDNAFVSCESKYHQECSFQYTRKAGWMKKVYIFLFLFIFRKSFDWTVVQPGDCQNCDIIPIMFPLSTCALTDTFDIDQITGLSNLFFP